MRPMVVAFLWGYGGLGVGELGPAAGTIDSVVAKPYVRSDFLDFGRSTGGGGGLDLEFDLLGTRIGGRGQGWRAGRAGAGLRWWPFQLLRSKAFRGAILRQIMRHRGGSRRKEMHPLAFGQRVKPTRSGRRCCFGGTRGKKSRSHGDATRLFPFHLPPSRRSGPAHRITQSPPGGGHFFPGTNPPTHIFRKPAHSRPPLPTTPPP